MLNHIIIMERMVRDPELRSTQSGTSVCSFTLACDRDFKSKDGGEKETDFIDCVAWRSTAEFVSKYFTKGRMMAVEGRLQLRDWVDKEKNKRRSAEIQVSSAYFADSKSKEQEPPEVTHGAADGFPTGGFPEGPLPKGFDPFAGDGDDGDLPF
jgi:single-strand DNA-binding protein